jgi:DEAD/DEAH box helicase domain-containing protein
VDCPERQKGRALVLMPLKALAHDQARARRSHLRHSVLASASVVANAKHNLTRVQLRATRELLALAGQCAEAAAATTPPALPAASIALLRRMADLTCCAYDGDTPQEERPELRRTARIVFTNVDMLHVSIVPNHKLWSRAFWANLKHVVLDEAHTYTGVYGSHAALVFRRLLRVVASYCKPGAAPPAFLCSSATIANPGEHILLLTGAQPVCVTRSGAPAGAKALLLWQPPELPPSADAAAGEEETAPQRKSMYNEAGEVIAELVMAGLRPLVFVSARKLAEIVAHKAREMLQQKGFAVAAAGVESYRGGYAANERRQLEANLVSGRITAVVSTSALELGIDVGSLDATVHVGVPETASAQWQQAGRAGRRGTSLAVVITAERPLDQFFLGSPALLATRAPEAAHIDPANLALLALHLPAAAAEHALIAEDAPLFGGMAVYEPLLQQAVNARALKYNAALRMYDCTLANAAAGIAIRGGLSRDKYTLHDQARMASHGGGAPCTASFIEDVEARKAFIKVHVGAIFRHRLETYEVVALDVAARVARARLIGDVPFATAPKERVAVREVRVAQRRAVGAATAWLGRVHVTGHVIGYVKMDLVHNKKLFEKEFPPPGLLATDMQTDGVWWDLPQEVTQRLGTGGALRPAVAGARNLAAALLPSFCACDVSDIGAAVVVPGDDGTDPDGAVRIFVYDCFGGVGLCAKVFAELEELWRLALAVLQRCPCATGCASCTQATRQGAEAKTNKAECKIVLQGLLGAWMQGGDRRGSGGSIGTASASTGGVV